MRPLHPVLGDPASYAASDTIDFQIINFTRPEGLSAHSSHDVDIVAMPGENWRFLAKNVLIELFGLLQLPTQGIRADILINVQIASYYVK